METTLFEDLLPRLAHAESDLGTIRRDLRLAIAEAQTVTTPQAAQSTPPVPPRPEITETPVAAPSLPMPAQRTATDVEVLLGGRWLHLAGLFLVFIGAAFFLKVAFDHDWITPVFRVALGLVAGAGGIVYAQSLARKGMTYFSEGITALGAAIEFLSLYSSNALFHLASPAIVLVGMIGVNAVLASLAWRRHSERLGILAAAGGFLAPMLAGSQGTDQWMLAGYLGMLDVGLLLLAELLDSRIIAPLAVAGTLAYAFGSISTASSLDDVARAAIYAMLYACFAGAGWIVTKTRGTLDPLRSIVGGVALGALLLGLESSLNAGHRPILATALIVLTALHLLAAILLKSRYHSWLAAAALTFAIPAAFTDGAVNIAWALEAVVLSIAGLRFRDDVLRFAGLGLLGLDVARDASSYFTYSAATPIFNERFASFVAAFVAAYAIALGTDLSGTASYDAGLVRTLRVAAHAIALFALSTEAWDAVRYYGGTAQGSSAALSIVWAVFAAALIGWGLYKRDSFLRWEGLGLIVLTAAKVLVVDISFLDLAYRVISAVLVGIALIGVSYAYQRRPLPDESRS